MDLIEDTCAADFATDPRPGWSGVPTLFGCPLVEAAKVSGVNYAVAGVPFDATASSRPGAAEGPLAIRVASRVFASYLDCLGEHEMFDTRTGRSFWYTRPSLVDVGDFHVYPTDIPRTVRAVAAEGRGLYSAGVVPIFLGGDHSVSLPLFAGLVLQLNGDSGAKPLGFVQIDHHFDFGQHSPIHGPIYHGSNARRISELPGIRPDCIAFIGPGDVTKKEQLDRLLREGYMVVTAADIRRRGVPMALEHVIASLSQRCCGVYLSIDIDVLDGADAPGTGHVSIGGLRAAELFDLVYALRQLTLLAVDVVEVAPRYDPSGRTAQIAARLLFELIFRRGG
jgi:arginase family enzyme